MYKMHYFSNKFSKIAKRRGLSAASPLTFFSGDLKLHDLVKLCFSNWLWWNRNLKIIYVYDVISVTSSSLRCRKTSPKERHKIFPFWTPPNQNFWLRQYSYISLL